MRDIVFCVGFFTRLPVPTLDLRDRGLAAAIWAAPLAGLLVALIGAAIYAILDAAGLSHGTSPALALAATMAATGCLHEDGLSDTADGFGGGRDRERKLEIMRDSRIGTYGAAALGLSILIRWSALQDIGDPVRVLAALVAAHVASRALMPAFMAILPPARAQGLSAGAGAVQWPTASIALVIGFAALLPLGLHATLASAAVLFFVFILFRSLCLRQIGGQTGDTVGALQQLGEMTILLTASAFL